MIVFLKLLLCILFTKHNAPLISDGPKQWPFCDHYYVINKSIWHITQKAYGLFISSTLSLDNTAIRKDNTRDSVKQARRRWAKVIPGLEGGVKTY